MWDFVRVLDWLLVTLLLNMLLAVRTTGVTMISFTLPMIAVAIAVTNFVTNNVAGVVNILVLIVTMFGDNVLTFLNQSGCHYNFMFLVAHLLVMTLLLVHNVVVEGALDITQGWKCLGSTGEKKKSTKSEHFTGENLPTLSCEKELKESDSKCQVAQYLYSLPIMTFVPGALIRPDQ